MGVMLFKAGSTWDFSGPLTDAAGDAVDLTGATIQSEIRNLDGELIGTLACTAPVPTTGVVNTRAEAAATATWPLGTAQLDVKVITADGDVLFTSTAAFEIVARVTA